MSNCKEFSVRAISDFIIAYAHLDLISCRRDEIIPRVEYHAEQLAKFAATIKETGYQTNSDLLYGAVATLADMCRLDQSLRKKCEVMEEMDDTENEAYKRYKYAYESVPVFTRSFMGKLPSHYTSDRQENV